MKPQINQTPVELATTSRTGVVQPDGSTISISASGVIAAIAGPLVAPTAYLYVGKNGNDGTGTGSANAPYLTVGAAITAASSGTTVFIWPGSYIENITFKAGVNLTSPAKFAVTITGNHTSNFTGTIIVDNVILTSATGTTLAVSGTTAQNLQLYNSDINSGTGDGVNYTNTNASSKLLLTDSNVSVVTSGGSARAIYTGASSAGSIQLNRASVKLDSAANIAVALNGAVSYIHTSDVIYGQVTVANTVSATIAMVTMTATGAANLTTNSSGLTTVAEVIASTNVSPAFAGAGALAFLALAETSTGFGGAATLNGGLGALPIALAPIKIRPYTLLPAGAVAAGLVAGTFEYDGTHLYFTTGTTRNTIV